MTKFDVPTTQSVKLGNFKGVDYVNSETNVDLTRATEMRNFIHKDKINQKRNGFTQRAFIHDEITDESLAVNGHWEFTDSYGNKHTIIHAGNKIFKYYYGEDVFSNTQIDITKSSRYVPEYITEANPLEFWRNKLANGIKNEPSFGVVRGDRLYILCGMYVVYGVWCEEVETFNDLPVLNLTDKKTYYVNNENKFYRVNATSGNYIVCVDPYELRLVQDNEDTYVPVITTGIGAQGSISQGTSKSADEANMLSSRRRVKLFGELPDSTLGYTLIPAKEADKYLYSYSKSYKYDTSGDLVQTSLAEEKQYLIDVGTPGMSTANALFYIPMANCKYIDLLFTTNTKISKVRLLIGSPNNGNEYDSNYSQQDISNSYVELEGEPNIKPYELVECIDADVKYNYTTQELYVKILIGQKQEGINEALTVICRAGADLEYSLGTTRIDTTTSVEIRALKPGLEFTNVFLRKNSSNESEMISEKDSWKLNVKTGILSVPYIVESSYEGEMVIEVEFSSTENKDSADKINGCKFGCMFGYNEAQQLFVGGNPDYPNMDWHSSSRDSTEIKYDLLEYEDLTYFGELSYTSVGSPVNPIIGYILLEDSTMAILKEYNSNEPNMFLRKAYIGDAVDISGNVVTDLNGNTFQKIYYSMISSTIGEGCIAPKSCANLAGDKLFLSKNGIYALELNANIKSEERYAKERSRLVDNQLVKEPNLHNAIAIVFQNRYYLALGTKIYIADARFKNQLSSEMTDTFSYEYFIWEWEDNGAKITSLFIKDEQLWFGTDNGRVCAFDNSDSYLDKMYEFFYSGGISTIDNQTFEINSRYNLKEDDVISLLFAEGKMYELVHERTLEEGEIIDNKIITTQDQLIYYIRWSENQVVYARNTSLLKEDYPYVIKNVDIENYTYELYDGETNEIVVLPADAEFTLCKPLDKNSVVHMIDEVNFKIKNYQDGLNEKFEIVPLYKTIIGDGTFLEGAIQNFKNVVAYWYTPVMNMGVSNYLKTTQYLTITPEAINNGNVEVSVITRKKLKDFSTQGIDTMDLEEVRYTDIAFDISTFERAYSKKLKIKNFNFLQILFKSDNDKNCIIKEICLDYIITKRSKGVK